MAGENSLRLGETLGGAVKVAAGLSFLAAGGWIAYSITSVRHHMPLPPALNAARREVNGRAGAVNVYAAGEGTPLLLIHSINAAASAYEVRPIFEHFQETRRVYAVDLPGFGFSDRGPRDYSPRLYTDAILDALDEIERETGGQPVDALALSLSGEFLARAAVEQPHRLRSLALVTPTGFGKDEQFYAPFGATRGNRLPEQVLEFPLWRRPFYDLLTSKPSIHYFLKQAFGSEEAIDAGLEAYDYFTSHQPDAEHAPYAFISGRLFSADIDRIYEMVGQPAWLAYGPRNGFSDYGDLSNVEGRANWRIQRFETGGMPHFEKPESFNAAYEAFLAELVPAIPA